MIRINFDNLDDTLKCHVYNCIQYCIIIDAICEDEKDIDKRTEKCDPFSILFNQNIMSSAIEYYNRYFVKGIKNKAIIIFDKKFLSYSVEIHITEKEFIFSMYAPYRLGYITFQRAIIVFKIKWPERKKEE